MNRSSEKMRVSYRTLETGSGNNENHQDLLEYSIQSLSTTISTKHTIHYENNASQLSAEDQELYEEFTVKSESQTCHNVQSRKRGMSPNQLLNSEQLITSDQNDIDDSEERVTPDNHEDDVDDDDVDDDDDGGDDNREGDDDNEEEDDDDCYGINGDREEIGEDDEESLNEMAAQLQRYYSKQQDENSENGGDVVVEYNESSSYDDRKQMELHHLKDSKEVKNCEPGKSNSSTIPNVKADVILEYMLQEGHISKDLVFREYYKRFTPLRYENHPKLVDEWENDDDEGYWKIMAVPGVDDIYEYVDQEDEYPDQQRDEEVEDDDDLDDDSEDDDQAILPRDAILETYKNLDEKSQERTREKVREADLKLGDVEEMHDEVKSIESIVTSECQVEKKTQELMKNFDDSFTANNLSLDSSSATDNGMSAIENDLIDDPNYIMIKIVPESDYIIVKLVPLSEIIYFETPEVEDEDEGEIDFVEKIQETDSKNVSFEVDEKRNLNQSSSSQTSQIHVRPKEYDIIYLPIIHEKNKTGFEDSKDFPIEENAIIAGRYQIIQYLGSAAFSRAVQCLDIQSNHMVCIKIIKNNKDFFDQSLDEIKLLRYINSKGDPDEYNVVRLYVYNRENDDEIYFTIPRLQKITKQILNGLHFIHSLGLIHCDLKPENILIKSYSRTEIKIIDFGSSCFIHDNLCNYVQSRTYRAPEVILGLPYDQKIDVWSLGCILAELCTGKVLFNNSSIQTMLSKIIGLCGMFDTEMMSKGKFVRKFFTINRVLFERKRTKRRHKKKLIYFLIPKKTNLVARLGTDDILFVDFIAQCLNTNPKKRFSVGEALNHPWITKKYDSQI